MSQEQTKKSKCLNYYKIKDSKADRANAIIIRCYTDYTSLWICTNPFDTEYCSLIEKAYNPPYPIEPFFLKMIEIPVTQEMFDNQDNWKF